MSRSNKPRTIGAEDALRRRIDKAHEIIARLDAISDPKARAILDHHSPTKGYGCYCEGCDMGCSCEAAAWPCSTVRLVGSWFGIDVPEPWTYGTEYGLAVKERATIQSEATG